MGNQGQMVRKYMAMRLNNGRMSQMMHASKENGTASSWNREKARRGSRNVGTFI